LTEEKEGNEGDFNFVSFVSFCARFFIFHAAHVFDLQLDQMRSSASEERRRPRLPQAAPSQPVSSSPVQFGCTMTPARD
jgi:hypothetical protein